MTSPPTAPATGPSTSRHDLLECRELVVRYRTPAGMINALAGASFSVESGRTTAVIGESGSGKSTAAKVAVGMVKPAAGIVRFDGRDIHSMSRRPRADFRRSVQMVFQDPYGSLDPRMTVQRSIAEPLEIARRHVPASPSDHVYTSARDRTERVHELLRWVGLGKDLAGRHPDQLSGGQCQRVALARALALNPRLIVADELVSALDVSVQAQVLNLVRTLQTDLGVACLFIAHDLAVVHQIADTVVVMYLGRVIESGPVDEVVSAPAHPYTAALLAATPSVMRTPVAKAARLRGEAPSPIAPPPGCALHPRCPIARPICREIPPPLRSVGHGRESACHFPQDVAPVLPTVTRSRSETVSVVQVSRGESDGD